VIATCVRTPHSWKCVNKCLGDLYNLFLNANWACCKLMQTDQEVIGQIPTCWTISLILKLTWPNRCWYIVDIVTKVLSLWLHFPLPRSTSDVYATTTKQSGATSRNQLEIESRRRLCLSKWFSSPHNVRRGLQVSSSAFFAVLWTLSRERKSALLPRTFDLRGQGEAWNDPSKPIGAL